MKKILNNMFPAIFMTAVIMLGIYTKSNAVPLSMFNSWSLLASEDQVNKDGYIGPGNGGQEFDAEYLFYKVDGNKLSIGLQTGFNVKDPLFVDVFGRQYYSGDLALSFDGSPSSYEYAIDFGFLTKDKFGFVGGNITPGFDSAGLYQVTQWNNNLKYPEANPYAMESGTMLSNLFDNYGGLGSNPLTEDSFLYHGGPVSYFRVVSFQSDLFDYNNLSAHWTMSCGNDEIHGNVAVPEPGTMFLLGSLATGLFGFAGLRRRFTN